MKKFQDDKKNAIKLSKLFESFPSLHFVLNFSSFQHPPPLKAQKSALGGFITHVMKTMKL